MNQLIASAYPRPASLAAPITGMRGLTFRRPTISLNAKGIPLMPLSSKEMNQQIQDSAVDRLIEIAHDSITRLKAEGKSEDLVQIQGAVGAMMEIQRKGDVRVDHRVVFKAWEAIDAIQQRHYDKAARQWRTPIQITAPEMANLSKAAEHYGAQLLHLTRAEAIAAIKQSQDWTEKQARDIAAKIRRQIKTDA